MTPDSGVEHPGGPAIGILGPGAVGRALAVNLTAAGYRVALIVGRNLDAANSVARLLPAAVASERLEDLPGESEWVFCTVPDDALTGIAERLSTRGQAWRGRVVAHTSGLRSSRVLEPLGMLGAEVASLHPVQTFPPTGPVPSLAGVFFGLEGTPAAVTAGRALISRLKGHVIELRPEAKALYHLSAVAASNYFVTLIACVKETLHAAGLDAGTGLQFLGPLIESTWKNILLTGPEAALTGPIVRGDRGTVLEHLGAIHAQVPHLAPFYAALMMEAVRLAVRSGRLTSDRASSILEDLHSWIGAWSTG